MSALVEILAGYVPAFVAQRLVAHPAALEEPLAEQFEAGVLFADITGFTALSEQLAQQGPQGAETISCILNEYFGALIDLIHAYGGDVVKFAGDALLAIWIAVPDASAGGRAMRAAPLRRAARAAARCALEIRDRLNNYYVEEGGLMRLRVGVSAGPITAMHLGGLRGRWEYLLLGEAITNASLAEGLAQAGEVILSAEAWRLVGGDPQAEATPLEGAGGWVRLEHQSMPPVHPLQMPELDADTEAALRTYVPRAILDRLEAQQSAYLSELRRVTILFINLPDLQRTTSLEQAQTVILTLQTALYHYEGSLNKLNVDDKGITFIAALGLPPFAHEDDAARGVLAALEIYQRLRETGVNVSIGVTTGRVFCGLIGSVQRQEYTMIGTIVNLSARLMTALTRVDDLPLPILCSEATVSAAGGRIEFDGLGKVRVKGRDEPIPIYCPRQEKRRGPRGGIQIVGRREERTLLVEHLRRLQRGESSVIIIDGEAGLGKSCLVDDLINQAEVMGVRSLMGAGDAVESATAYLAWRDVFGTFFGIQEAQSLEEQRSLLDQWLAAHPHIESLAALLSPLLPFGLPDNMLTAQMEGLARANNTRELLLAILQENCFQTPTLIVLEDAHWMDSASWALARHAAVQVSPLMLVLAVRPMSTAFSAEFERLANDPSTQHLLLPPLPDQDIIDMVCRCLDVNALPEEVASLVQTKAEGNPFFSEELAYALRDAHLIEMQEHTCQVAPGVDLQEVTFPDTVHGVVASRIDRLTPPQQLTLKVASIIGRIFAFRILYDIYPVPSDREALLVHLNTLERLDLTPRESIEPDLQYIFKHAITHEVAYNLMLFAQRRTLHQAAAEWYERVYTGNLAPYYPILAHHWNRAQEPRKTIYYLELAAEQALRNGAYREAIRFFGELINLEADPAAASEPALRRARRRRLLGNAYYGLGDMESAWKYFLETLDLLDRPQYASFLAAVGGFAWETFRQVVHRLVPVWRSSRGEQADIKLEAARTYAQMNHICYLNIDTAGLVLYALSELNNAEAAGGETPELAGAYGSASVIASVIPWLRLSALYESQALQTLKVVESQASQAWVRLALSTITVALGRWERGGEILEEAYETYMRLGDLRQMGETAAVMAFLKLDSAQYEDALVWYARLLEIGQRSESEQFRIWALDGMVLVHNHRRRHEASLALLEQSAVLLEHPIDYGARVTHASARAQAYLMAGDLPKALDWAGRACELLENVSPSLFSMLDGYSGAVEVYLKAWELQNGNRRSSYRERARQSLARLQRFARSFPMARPRTLLYQGLYQWLDGHLSKALHTWQQARELARRMHMPLEEGLALYELGRHATGVEREHLLADAHSILAGLDIVLD